METSTTGSGGALRCACCDLPCLLALLHEKMPSDLLSHSAGQLCVACLYCADPALLMPRPAAAVGRYDKRDGRGKMTFVRGLQYDGEWKDDKAHGWVQLQQGMGAGSGSTRFGLVVEGCSRAWRSGAWVAAEG